MSDLTIIDHLDRVETELARIDLDALASATKDRMGGSHKRVLKAWMWHTFGGLCILCECMTTLDQKEMHSDHYAHLGHLLSAFDIAKRTGRPYATNGQKGGHMAPNLAIQCRRCNRDNGHESLNLRDIARPQDIPLEWPTLTKRANTRIAW